MIIIRNKLTFMFMTRKKDYVLQITTKDPWWFPKVDRNFLNGEVTLYGWLFFYFGYFNNKRQNRSGIKWN